MSISLKAHPKHHYGRHVPVAIMLVIILLLIRYFWQEEPEEITPIRAKANLSTMVFGPGQTTPPANTVDTSFSPSDSRLLPNGLTTENQQLVVNSGLLEVIHFFLLEQMSADRAGALRSHLKSALPPPAYTEAMLIVEHYQAYMKAHDELLAAHNFGGTGKDVNLQDVRRISTWRDQRDRLRLGFLGETVVHAWYQNDDAQLDQILNELTQLKDNSIQEQNPNAPSTDEQPAIPRPPTWSNKNDELRHDHYMQWVLGKAIRSFSSWANTGPQLASRLTGYLDAAGQINQNRQLNFSERVIQTQELLIKSFPVEAERQRARDLMFPSH
ncbi:hypothetical protein ACO0K9_09370 [Undibacterium sp. Ji50W]|uniref:hypothetical protein n=1 Tax=Undibacterium sp. Ji50W TaxID=3413041 RepID=UPI003BF0C9FD